MSGQSAISVNALSKTFRLYASRRDRIREFISPFKKSYHRDFKALQDVSFTVEKGEVLGIIGENGSGKSTLLKMLCSVVTPTSGSFSCNGRVTALLELGGGFNNDLTGVENVYYLGAIQGYSKKEMASKLRDILDFADIGEYAYQPVISYSSGMYVRLAFSMAINIDPDILITDEALAVGDIRFQQRCYRKIREFKDAGKTIIMCTHSLNAVKDFCSRAIWLHEGKIREEGDPVFVTESYNAFMTSRNAEAVELNQADSRKQALHPLDPELLPLMYRSARWSDLSGCESYGSGELHILHAALVDSASHAGISLLRGGEEVRVLLFIKATSLIPNPDIHIVLNGPFGNSVFKICNSVYGQALKFSPDRAELLSVSFTFPCIGNGHYTISAGLLAHENGNSRIVHWVHDAITAEVFNQDLKYRLATQLVIDHAKYETIPV